MSDIIRPLLEMYKRGVKPASVVSQVLERIDQSTINAFISVQADMALAQAQAMEGALPTSDRPLHGVVVAIKDLIDVQGCPTTLGAEGLEGNIAQKDAHVVARLRDAGAIFIGKTNTHQFAYGPMGDRSAAGPALNPRNQALMTGGSSSGSAAAVAAGLAHGAVGSDTAASIRLPASFCGVVGMKPTMDLIPAEGVFPLSQTLDHLGPLTATCEDNARMLAVMADRPVDLYCQLIGKSVNKLVVGLPDSFFSTHWSTPIGAAMAQAVKLLKEGGVEVRTVSIKQIDEIYEAQQCILRAEAYALHADRLAAGAPYEKEVRERLLAGQSITADDYKQALKFQPAAKEYFDQTLTEVDAILTPTCGITAPRLQERQTELNGEIVPTRWLLTRLTAPMNLSGHPSLSVPFGHDHTGMPIGLQLIGRYHEEAVLYQLGHFISTSQF